MRFRKIFLLALLAVGYSWGASVSFPSAPVPTGRFATGIGYDYNGGFLHKVSEISEEDKLLGFRIHPPLEHIPFRTRGINAFVSYGLSNFINIGVDVGVRDVRVVDNNLYALLFDDDPLLPADTLLFFRPDFDGRFGLSAGANLKLATPYMGDVMAIVGVARGQWYNSKDGRGGNSYYSGLNFTASGGLSFNATDFGYITLGAKYFEIMGKNHAYAHEGSGTYYAGGDGRWSNSAVLGGFVAVDYFPKSTIQNYIPFFSFEFSFFPDKKGFSGSNPVLRSAGFAVTAGAFSRRVVGDKDEIWRP